MFSAAGSTLAEILRAGDWKSTSFLSYLNMTTIESGAVLESALAEASDSESETSEAVCATDSDSSDAS